MSILVFTPDRNTFGKHDFDGAFLPEAMKFLDVAQPNSVAPALLRISGEQKLAVRRADQLEAISLGGVSVLAYFCHGTPSGLPQMGWHCGNVSWLAGELSAYCAPDLRVILYSCSTAGGSGLGGDGGFADRLRDGLASRGVAQVQVDAHYGAGHTTKNPRVRRFDSSTSRGGQFLVEPPPSQNGSGHMHAPFDSELWRKWTKALRETDLRFRFPFMTKEEIHGHLRNGA